MPYYTIQVTQIVVNLQQRDMAWDRAPPVSLMHKLKGNQKAA